jgi:hypothetical protein
MGSSLPGAAEDEFSISAAFQISARSFVCCQIYRAGSPVKPDEFSNTGAWQIFSFKKIRNRFDGSSSMVENLSTSVLLTDTTITRRAPPYL